MEDHAQRPQIFIAHSTADIKIGRALRNLLEDLDHDALLLKLAHQMEETYLRTLLRNEVQARDWMVLIDSPDSRESAWVAEEVEQAQIDAKRIFVVNSARYSAILDRYQLEAAVRACAVAISRSIRVFFSYARRDRMIVQQVHDYLQDIGYEVWLDLDQLQAGQDWQRVYNAAIAETLERGLFAVFISANSLHSEVVMQEIEAAIARKANIIPCLVEPRPMDVPPQLSRYHFIDFTYDIAQGVYQLQQIIEQARESYCD